MNFAKHRTFYIREGWLSKGLRVVKERPCIFTPANREEAIDYLGIGKTMVASLRFWMEATGLTEESRGSNSMIEHQLTELGEFILDNDPYFEDINSLWLIHYKLSTQEELATTWHWFFNCFSDNFFDKESFIIKLDRYIQEELGIEVAESSLKKDFLCFKNTYLYEVNQNYQENPESALTCPLKDLELIIKDQNNNFYINNNLDHLNDEILYYTILDQNDLNKDDQISFEELLENENSPGKIFRLSKNQLLNHLEVLSKKGYLEIQKGFGHNFITIVADDKQNILVNAYNNHKRGDTVCLK
ncbi:DUF4007 family protein [Orenia marismortui]|uniref:Uncharacterized protein DUF4007 n=1 Tax=Orenia marismortui TaxID=46469 RepID=A0A4R8H3C0_9FIRM|nr:DUF4007 family protein [Orenia marismortui]TDX53240.1 uncharacterized protein DUF4007 [Orenia marismortui]